MSWGWVLTKKQAGAELGQAQLPTGICLYFDYHLFHCIDEYGIVLDSTIETNHYFPIKMSIQNEQLLSTTLASPAIPPSLVHVTTTNQPKNIHFLSTCYLLTLFGQFKAVSLLFWVGRWVGGYK